ncbi:MAG: SEL1-like repeat protein [Clostridia bacterium]|nr:SEL1-like repeat protein [Clostridia bacterium]
MNEEKMQKIRELEKELSFMIDPEKSLDEKLKVLDSSYWRAHNAGYCDYMAGQRMAGVDNWQVDQHDRDLKYKWEVGRLAELLTELKNEELWNQASRLFDEDKEAGFRAWLELCEQGDARSAHTVGWCLRNGYGTEKDVARSEEYYRLAISRGYVNSYNGLYWLLTENGKSEGTVELLLEGAAKNSAGCYDTLAGLCDRGEIFGGNMRVAAFLAARAYELDPTCGAMLGMYYMNGQFLPQVYPYAKYCLEKAGFTKAELEECGVELPEGWDSIESIAPKYPDFGLTLDTCEGAVDPDALMEKAYGLIYGDEPDREAAKPLVLEAARAGSSKAMYYTYILGMDECDNLLVRGADEYGNLDCIELLASLFTENATFKVGNTFLNHAVRYWNMRKKLHGSIPLSEEMAKSYEVYSKGLDEALGNVTYEYDPDANAVLLRADGTFDKIKVDFGSLAGLYAPLGCDRINIISTPSVRNISDMLGFTVVMYCDERGMQKRLPENGRAALMSGYDVIFGDAVICGFKDDYVPLYRHEVEAVCEMLKIC